MNRFFTKIALGFAAAIALSAPAATRLEITKDFVPGLSKPIYVSLSGITGEAAQVLQFDLYVQGFAFTNAENAQYLISGTAGANLQARVADRLNNETLVAKAYSGASLRRQTHAFVDDFTKALERRPIAQTKIAFRGHSGKNAELYIADFDGFGAQQLTRDDSLVAVPAWVPGKLALFYVTYKLNNPDIFQQDLSSGARKVFARYGGSNLSPSVSPDGSKVAMILSKDGWTDLYVANADGSNLRRLTKSPQDESSPCWSPDGQYICVAAKERERRTLCKIPAAGGSLQAISTGGVPNPTEPDWSPDGKWIAFTSQTRSFSVCVVPANGGTATTLVTGEDPSWAPNSRTLIFARNTGKGSVLSLLDVPTKQYKDVSRTTGSNSQSQPAWAR